MPKQPQHLARFTLGLSIGTVLLLSFGQLLRVELPQRIAIYPHDVLLPLVILLAFLMISRTTVMSCCREISHYRLEFITGVLFFLAATIRLVMQGDPIQLMYLLRIALYSLALGMMIKCVLPPRMQRWLFYSSILLFLWLSFVLYFMFPDARGLSFFGWDDHYYRMIGTLFDPNFTGMVLVAGIIWSLWITILQPQYAVLKSAALISFLAFSLGIGLTFSRSSFLSLGTALVCFGVIIFFQKRLLFKKSLQLAALSITCVILALILAPKPGGEGVTLLRTTSVQTRVTADIQQIQQKQLDLPVLLLGPVSFLFDTSNITTSPAQALPSYHPKTANNIFVTLFTWGGVVGLGLILVLLIKWGVYTVRWYPGAFIIGFAWLVHAQFNNSILEPFCFLLIGGLLLSMIHVSKYLHLN